MKTQQAEEDPTPFVSESLPLEALADRTGLARDSHAWLDENRVVDEDGEAAIDKYTAHQLADDHNRTLRALQLLVVAGHVEAEKVYQAFEWEATLAG